MLASGWIKLSCRNCWKKTGFFGYWKKWLDQTIDEEVSEVDFLLVLSMTISHDATKVSNLFSWQCSRNCTQNIIWLSISICNLSYSLLFGNRVGWCSGTTFCRRPCPSTSAMPTSCTQQNRRQHHMTSSCTLSNASRTICGLCSCRVPNTPEKPMSKSSGRVGCHFSVCQLPLLAGLRRYPCSFSHLLQYDCVASFWKLSLCVGRSWSCCFVRNLCEFWPFPVPFLEIVKRS